MRTRMQSPARTAHTIRVRWRRQQSPWLGQAWYLRHASSGCAGRYAHGDRTERTLHSWQTVVQFYVRPLLRLRKVVKTRAFRSDDARILHPGHDGKTGVVNSCRRPPPKEGLPSASLKASSRIYKENAKPVLECPTTTSAWGAA